MPQHQREVPEGVEIDKQVVEEGKVKFGTKTAMTNPAPAKMKRIIKALNYFCVGLITAVGATDLFTGTQTKVIVFVIGVIVLALGSLEFLTGVKPIEDEK